METLHSKPDVEVLVENETNIGLVSRVLLFNDEWHSFEEVIVQLIKALQCSFEEAFEFTSEAHEHGKAAVFAGEITQCLKVSSVLEEIALHTQIET